MSSPQYMAPQAWMETGAEYASRFAFAFGHSGDWDCIAEHDAEFLHQLSHADGGCFGKHRRAR